MKQVGSISLLLLLWIASGQIFADSVRGSKNNKPNKEVEDFGFTADSFDFEKELEKIERDAKRIDAEKAKVVTNKPAKDSVRPLDFSILDENGTDIGSDAFLQKNSEGSQDTSTNALPKSDPSNSSPQKSPLEADFDDLQNEFKEVEEKFSPKKEGPSEKKESDKKQSVDPKPLPQGNSSGSHEDYMIQVNAFTNPQKAEDFSQRIREMGFSPVFIQPILVHQRQFYRVNILQYHSKEEVLQDLKVLRGKGYSPIFKKYMFTAK